MNKKLIVGGSLGVAGAVATFVGVVLTQGFTTEALIAAVVGASGFVALLAKVIGGSKK